MLRTSSTYLTAICSVHVVKGLVITVESEYLQPCNYRQAKLRSRLTAANWLSFLKAGVQIIKSPSEARCGKYMLLGKHVSVLF